MRIPGSPTGFRSVPTGWSITRELSLRPRSVRSAPSSTASATSVFVSRRPRRRAGRHGDMPQGMSRTVSMQDLCGDCTPEKWVQCGDFLEGPAFDDKGNLWMVSIESGNIEKVTPDGKCTTATETGGEPQGLKFHDGKLYGVDRKRGVFTIDPATGKVEDYMRYFNNENFHGPNDLIVDQEGGIYFTDPWGSSVLNADRRPVLRVQGQEDLAAGRQSALPERDRSVARRQDALHRRLQRPGSDRGAGALAGHDRRRLCPCRGASQRRLGHRRHGGRRQGQRLHRPLHGRRGRGPRSGRLHRRYHPAAGRGRQADHQPGLPRGPSCTSPRPARTKSGASR